MTFPPQGNPIGLRTFRIGLALAEARIASTGAYITAASTPAYVAAGNYIEWAAGAGGVAIWWPVANLPLLVTGTWNLATLYVLASKTSNADVLSFDAIQPKKTVFTLDGSSPGFLASFFDYIDGAPIAAASTAVRVWSLTVTPKSPVLAFQIARSELSFAGANPADAVRISAAWMELSVSS